MIIKSLSFEEAISHIVKDLRNGKHSYIISVRRSKILREVLEFTEYGLKFVSVEYYLQGLTEDVYIREYACITEEDVKQDDWVYFETLDDVKEWYKNLKDE